MITHRQGHLSGPRPFPGSNRSHSMENTSQTSSVRDYMKQRSMTSTLTAQGPILNMNPYTSPPLSARSPAVHVSKSMDQYQTAHSLHPSLTESDSLDVSRIVTENPSDSSNEHNKTVITLHSNSSSSAYRPLSPSEVHHQPTGPLDPIEEVSQEHVTFESTPKYSHSQAISKMHASPSQESFVQGDEVPYYKQIPYEPVSMAPSHTLSTNNKKQSMKMDSVPVSRTIQTSSSPLLESNHDPILMKGAVWLKRNSILLSPLKRRLILCLPKYPQDIPIVLGCISPLFKALPNEPSPILTHLVGNISMSMVQKTPLLILCHETDTADPSVLKEPRFIPLQSILNIRLESELNQACHFALRLVNKFSSKEEKLLFMADRSYEYLDWVSAFERVRDHLFKPPFEQVYSFSKMPPEEQFVLQLKNTHAQTQEPGHHDEEWEYSEMGYVELEKKPKSMKSSVNEDKAIHDLNAAIEQLSTTLHPKQAGRPSLESSRVHLQQEQEEFYNRRKSMSVTEYRTDYLDTQQSHVYGIESKSSRLPRKSLSCDDKLADDPNRPSDQWYYNPYRRSPLRVSTVADEPEQSKNTLREWASKSKSWFKAKFGSKGSKDKADELQDYSENPANPENPVEEAPLRRESLDVMSQPEKVAPKRYSLGDSLKGLKIVSPQEAKLKVQRKSLAMDSFVTASPYEESRFLGGHDQQVYQIQDKKLSHKTSSVSDRTLPPLPSDQSAFLETPHTGVPATPNQSFSVA